MPRTCTLCNHARRDELDRALLGGASFRHIAAQFGTSTSALQRHKAEHLPKALVKAKAAGEVFRAESLLDYLQERRDGLDRLDEDARQIQEEARREKDRHCALDAIKTRTGIARAQQGYCDLWGRLTGEAAGTLLQQNIIWQILAIPKLGESLPQLALGPLSPPAIETTAQLSLPPAQSGGSAS